MKAVTSRRPIGIVYILFFLSGACGLTYQVVWTRLISQVFGNTVFAVSTVLAAFMAGLALGSYVLGKRADRIDNPLRRYALYELGIGLTALVALVVLDRLTPFYLWMHNTFDDSFFLFSLVRFLTIFCIILVPTTLMGATLPVLSRLIIHRVENLGRSLSGLYATNTLGAVCGSLLSGFYLIRIAGTHPTIYLAAACNAMVGIFAWHLSKHVVATPACKQASPATLLEIEGNRRSPRNRWMTRLVLGGFALSGFTAFAYEILWMRALVFYMGNSTYAFVLMISAFLVGITFGGYLARLFVDRIHNPLQCFGWVQLGLGCSAAAVLPLLVVLLQSSVVTAFSEHIFRDGQQHLIAGFGIALFVMLIPTILIGTTFPLASKIVIRDLRQAGADIGKVYAVNTLGNIAGALIPGFLILPFLGIQKSALLMAALNLGIGSLVLVCIRRGFSRLVVLLPLALIVFLSVIQARPLHFQFPADTQHADDDVLFYKEGIAATTKVFISKQTGDKRMAVDGIEIGGSSPRIDYKQQWLAHLPKLLLKSYDRELSVGLGSGILVGESARHTDLNEIVCVEIAPSVVEGARFFAEENHGVLDAPRVTIITQDAVNYLLVDKTLYDIISTDGKTEPEYAVNGTFFSHEYYSLMRDHLTEKGLAIQWIPLHYPPRIFRSVIRTFTSVFPHAQLWFSEGNCFLVGSHHIIPPDPTMISERLRDPQRPFDGLQKFGVTSAESLLSHFIGGEDVLRTATASAELNSLEKPVIEFYRLNDYATPSVERERQNLDLIISIRGKGAQGRQVAALSEEVSTAFRSEGAYLNGLQQILAQGTRAAMDHYFEEALALSANSDDIRYHISRHYLQSAHDAMTADAPEKAQSLLLQAVELWPNDVEAHQFLGELFLMKQKQEDAIVSFETAISFAPRQRFLRERLASVYLASGQLDEAIAHLQVIVHDDPDSFAALNNLGYILMKKQAFQKALPFLKRAYQMEPKEPAVIDNYAWALYQNGNVDKARAVIDQGQSYYVGSPNMTRHRKSILE